MTSTALPPIRLTELTDCGGCAAKLGADLLADALSGLGAQAAPDELIVGLAPADDAAVYRVSDDLAIIDGGSKTFATDVQPGVRPLLLDGFGHIAEAPSSTLGRMNEEHGMVTIGETDRGRLRIGDAPAFSLA